MGVDLVNDRENSFHLNWHSWHVLCEMAMVRGWEPAGTILDQEPEPDNDDAMEWDAGYGSNDGQYVTPDDAKQLAAALECFTDEAWLAWLKDFIAFAKEGGFRIW